MQDKQVPPLNTIPTDQASALRFEADFRRIFSGGPELTSKGSDYLRKKIEERP